MRSVIRPALVCAAAACLTVVGAAAAYGCPDHHEDGRASWAQQNSSYLDVENTETEISHSYVLINPGFVDN
jgi:hypothetical protein